MTKREKENVMNFHETRYGARFFDGQLPKLISALEKIATALNTPAPVYQMKSELPEDFLKDLYLGNYDPSNTPETEEARALTLEIMDYQARFREMLTPDAFELVMKYSALFEGRGVYDRIQAFAVGFQSAMMMLTAGLGHQTNNEMEE